VSAPKRRPTPRRKLRPTTGPALRWSGDRPMFDYWGNELKRYYQMDTLANAMEGLLRGSGENFLTASARAELGAGPLSYFHFELFQEGRFQLIFRCHVGNAKKKKATFAFVVAKNHQECTTVAKAEHRILATLHERAPQIAVKPYQGGIVFLPDRHGRKAHGRSIYAYLTQWLQGYEELGVDKNLQFIVNIAKRHTFTLAETDLLKGQMIEMVLRSYDPVQRNSMALPEIASGDFVVRKLTKGAPKVKLIACRRMHQRMGPVRLLEKIFTTTWRWGERDFSLCPDDPQVFRQAINRALGPEVARDWRAQLRAAFEGKKIRGVNGPYLMEVVSGD